MIQEAVLQLSLLRQDGAVLTLCKKDVKILDIFAVEGVIELMSKAEEIGSQEMAIDKEDLSLSDAEIQDKTQEKVDVTEAATQSENVAETVDANPAKPETSDKDTQADIKIHLNDEVSHDAETQTVNETKTEEIEVQTDEKRIESGEETKVPAKEYSKESLSVHSVEVQTDDVAENVNLSQDDKIETEKGEKSIEVKSTSDKPVTENAMTQTDVDGGPVLHDLLARIGELQAQRESEGIKVEPSTSDSTPYRKGLRKRLFRRRISSTEASDDDADVDADVDHDDDYEDEVVSEDDYPAEEKSFVKVTKQWNKDLQTVISALEQDDNRPKLKVGATIKNASIAPLKSKRKRGRPRKVPQEVKHESSAEEDDESKEPLEKGEIEPLEKGEIPRKKRVFRCAGCDEKFTKRLLLKKHKMECTAPIMEKVPHEKTGHYQCPTCEKIYTKMAHLRRHQKSHLELKEHICSYCSKAFVRKEHKDKHELTHQVLKCQYCEEVVTGKANLIRHERSHFPSEPTPKKPAKKTTPCRYCGKMFGGKAQCEQHEITHTNERPYKCSFCEMCFSKRGNTLKHERRIHLQLKPYLCQYCGKAFAQKPDCKKHEMRHLGEKRVKCSYCEKMFLENHHRIVHERTHTGERPYKCVICNHAFAQSYDCKKHMRIHLKDKGGAKQSGPSSLTEEVKAVEYLQLQVHRQVKAVEESNNIQHQQLQAQQQQAQQEQQQANHPQPQQHIMEGAQMYPIYDYQTISTNALNPEYMMQAVASSTLHQIAPQAPAAVFAPHHDLQAGPFMQNTFDIRKMQEMMASQNNTDNTKLMP